MDMIYSFVPYQCSNYKFVLLCKGTQQFFVLWLIIFVAQEQNFLCQYCNVVDIDILSMEL